MQIGTDKLHPNLFVVRIAIINEGFEWISYKARLLVVLGRKLSLFKSLFLFFKNKCIFRFFTYF